MLCARVCLNYVCGWMRRPHPSCVMVTRSRDGSVHTHTGSAPAPAPPPLPPTLPPCVVWCPDFHDRKTRLFALVRDPKKFLPPAVVFVEEAAGADMLAATVSAKASLPARSWHAKLPPAVRDDVLLGCVGSV